MRNTELVFHKKLSETDNRFGEKLHTELPKESDKLEEMMKTNMQMQSNISGIRDEYISKRGNVTNNRCQKYNKTDKCCKDNPVTDRRESRNDKPVEINSGNNEKAEDSNLVQELNVDEHDKNDVHTHRRYDKKNSANFKDFQKSNSKNNLNHTEKIEKFDSFHGESPDVSFHSINVTFSVGTIPV